jgi:phenylacetyl-CoA:acceptor oxidoreductase 26-kDa subunit
VSYGPAPWQQESWDWRAAGNFIGGGAGSGLIVFTALSGAQGLALTALMLGGLALIGAGLLCVWLEIGRPLRALHVFFNPRTSWMTREALIATLLFPVGVAAAAGVPGFVWLVAALALVFVYCQSRMLRAARGIPAWRVPLLSPLMVFTGLVEGGGLFFLTDALHGKGALPLLVIFGALVLARLIAWVAYRRRLAATAAPRALAALDAAGRSLQLAGTLLPLALIALAVVVAMSGGAMGVVVGASGLLASITGAYVKYALVTRAGFNQGFALVHLPVRGVRR